MKQKYVVISTLIAMFVFGVIILMIFQAHKIPLNKTELFQLLIVAFAAIATINYGFVHKSKNEPS